MDGFTKNIVLTYPPQFVRKKGKDLSIPVKLKAFLLCLSYGCLKRAF